MCGTSQGVVWLKSGRCVAAHKGRCGVQATAQHASGDPQALLCQLAASLLCCASRAVLCHAVPCRAVLLCLQSFTSAGPRMQEISFQEFKTQLLGKGLVARLEVVNGNKARWVI